MRIRVFLAALLLFSLMGAGVTHASPASPSAKPGVTIAWAAAPGAVHPGVQVTTSSGQCTANFIYTAGADVYIGMAAHCGSTGGPTDTNGCLAGSIAVGSPVTIQGATLPGTLAYSSWLAMQGAGETDANTCQYNDFALVRIDPADVALVNPSVPYWGGPTGLDTNGTTLLERVYTYGNSSLRPVPILSPKTGTSLGTSGGGWTSSVYTITPGIPGDSGSAFMSSAGQALGVLVTVALIPLPLSNGVTDLNKALIYARAHGMPADLAVVNGTVPFNPNQIPPLLPVP